MNDVLVSSPAATISTPKMKPKRYSRHYFHEPACERADWVVLETIDFRQWMPSRCKL